MINGFYSAASGASGFQSRLSVSASNIANVSTIGFKAGSASFSDLLYSREGTPDGDNITVGNGSRLSSVVLDLGQGSFEETGRSLDAAINGEGFFALRGEGGQISYTRSGSFYLSEQEGRGYLVSANGQYVLGADMEPISAAAPYGELSLASPGQPVPSGGTALRPGIFRFDNRLALSFLGEGRYLETESSGGPVGDGDSTLISGALERSNVDIAAEMARLIEAQRGFALNARVIQSADEMENTANTLRG